jgi:hypothetical protein
MIQNDGARMLATATLGMLLYGTYSVGWALLDLVRGPRLEIWAELGQIGFGLLLILSAAFVRVRFPGGLALAIGAMLGLQAVAVHNAAHLATGLAGQIGQGAMAAALTALAYFAPQPRPSP